MTTNAQESVSCVTVKRVFFEGSIGAGKSTVMTKIQTDASLLRRILGARFADAISSDTLLIFAGEPLGDWIVDGVDLLAAFYADMKKNSFAFECCILKTRCAHLTTTILTALMAHVNAHGGVPPTSIVVLEERSLKSCRDVFSKMLHAGGLMEDAEWLAYEAMSVTSEESMKDTIGTVVDIFYKKATVDVTTLATVYVRSNPDELLRRIKARGRPAEVGGSAPITLEYLKQVEAAHERVYVDEAPADTVVLSAEELDEITKVK